MKRIHKDCWYISVPIYEQGLYLCTTPESKEKLYKSLEMEYTYYPAAGSVAPLYDEGTGQYSTVMEIHEHTEQTLVHECVHAAWYILDNAGVEVTADNQEPLAYLTDWLYSQCRSFAVSNEEE